MHAGKRFSDFRGLWAFLGYLGIAAAFTYPLILNLKTCLPGVGMDAYQFVWGFWHCQQAVFHLQNPFLTTEIFSPLKLNIFLHTWVPIKSFMAIPFLQFFSYVTTYNIFFILTYVAAALGAYFFIYSSTKDAPASFLGGMIFAFAPNQMAQGIGGHFNLISTEAIPWILYVWRSHRLEPRRFKGVLLALLGLYLFLCDYNLFVFMAMLAALGAAYKALTAREEFQESLKALQPVFVWFLVFLLPFLIMLLGQLRHFQVMSVSGPSWGAADIYSMDILSYLMPSELHPWWGQGAHKLIEGLNLAGSDRHWGNVFERTAAPGYLVLGTLVFGAIRYRKEDFVRFWTLAAVVFAVFSLGPVWHFLGTGLNSLPDFHLFSFHGIKMIFPAPYVFIRYLPFVNGLRIPARFCLLVILSAALLFSYTLPRILEEFQFLKSQRRIVLAAVFGVLLFEYLPSPYPLIPAGIPDVYQVIRSDADVTHVVLDLPHRPWASDLKPSFYQTYHRHYLIGGHTARILVEQEDYTKKYSMFRRISEGETIDPREFQEALEQLRVRYIVARGEKVIQAMESLGRSLPDMNVLKRDAAGEIELWEFTPPGAAAALIAR